MSRSGGIDATTCLGNACNWHLGDRYCGASADLRQLELSDLPAALRSVLQHGLQLYIDRPVPVLGDRAFGAVHQQSLLHPEPRARPAATPSPGRLLSLIHLDDLAADDRHATVHAA